MKRQLEAGFNLVELMVVVAIIGILSAVAMPRYANFKAVATQTEAKKGLNAMFVALESYHANFQEYPRNALGFSNQNSYGFAIAANSKYGYSIISNANGTKWVGWAWHTGLAPTINAGTGAPDGRALANDKLDSWRINTNKWLCSTYDAVTMRPANATPNVKTPASPGDCPETFDGNLTTPWQANIGLIADDPL